MVLQKRLDYGFNGYQVPAMPRACRSARGRGSLKRKVEETQMGAFELLATVAGKLLQERETSPALSNESARRTQITVVEDNVKQEQRDEEKSLKVEPCDQVSSHESVVVSEFGLQGHDQNNNLQEFARAQNNVVSGPASLIVNCDLSEKVGSAEETATGKSRSGNTSSKVKGGSTDNVEYYKGKVEGGIEKVGNLINGTVPDTCSSDDPLESDTKPPALVSSDSSIEVPLLREHLTCGSFPGCRDDVKLVSRDDEENSSGCTQPSTTPLKASRPPPHIEDRKIRKLLASKYWEVAPKLEGELSNTDGDMKPVFRNRKIFYTRQRSLRNPCKRRKLEKSSVSTSDGGVSSEGISSTPKKGTNGSTIGSGSTIHGGSGASSSSVAGQESSSQSKDSHVKLSIKSFRVPELFIEIPETATVGSLKRTVMEAVAAILGEGLHVGVLYQGKKIRDDSKTLLQTGICDEDKLDGLGFALEPSPTNAPSLCPKDPPFLVPCDTPQPLARYPTSPALDPGISDASPDPPMINMANSVESDHDSVPSPTDMSIDKNTPDSRALVAVPAMSVEALAVVPLHRKSRRSELVQRRIRRPFSVTEVEALVQAVEKLGTGRWRDVKLRAFDNAKHRTYVDLKDKWKTLVHTARISPQQRRGEPVPQELLDRVLAAHAYWSQQQAKQQVKQLTETCLLLNTS
ncbi:SANT/Myb domain [Macleaya cordata]|uniref:SANT/Myb domain n=1 Tax=Macleaya cordata TaxID=56857 RepID=A0A200R580_MACCD|nr:SANT/Myb domain [Macleaya cordata]